MRGGYRYFFRELRRVCCDVMNGLDVGGIAA